MSEQHIHKLRFSCQACGAEAAARPTTLGEAEFSAAQCPRCGAEGVHWSYHGAAHSELGDPEEAKQRERWENFKSIASAILVALIIRGFVFEAFKIPSPSMEPALLVGDQLFVKKYHYGIRMPFTKWWPIRFDTLRRGDVIVFRYPEDESVNYIKRVVGLPGDEVRVDGQKVYINGQQLIHEPTEGPGSQYDYYLETNDDRQYVVKYERGHDFGAATYRLGEDEIFAMGDNRNNSRDSRFWGPVPFNNLKGRASVIWLPRDCTQVYGLAGPRTDCNGLRWERFGQFVH